MCSAAAPHRCRGTERELQGCEVTGRNVSGSGKHRKSGNDPPKSSSGDVHQIRLGNHMVNQFSFSRLLICLRACCVPSVGPPKQIHHASVGKLRLNVHQLRYNVASPQ